MSKSDNDEASVLDTSKPAVDDEDAEIAALENDESAEATAIHEQRLQELHEESELAKKYISEGYGQYPEMLKENDLLDLIDKSTHIAVHFSKNDFARCGVIDTHLALIAPKHLRTRFAKIRVENSPFLVMKMCIKVLPCILCWVNGQSVDRIVGFEGLGAEPDHITTEDLENRLMSSGVVARKKPRDLDNTEQ